MFLFVPIMEQPLFLVALRVLLFRSMFHLFFTRLCIYRECVYCLLYATFLFISGTMEQSSNKSYGTKEFQCSIFYQRTEQQMEHGTLFFDETPLGFVFVLFISPPIPIIGIS